MNSDWYYVDPSKNDRVGPLAKIDLEKLFQTGQLKVSTYVWTKGFDDWKIAQDVNELNLKVSVQAPEVEKKEVTSLSRSTVSLSDVQWNDISRTKRIVHLMIGLDRGMHNGTEFGPFSWEEVKILKVKKE